MNATVKLSDYLVSELEKLNSKHVFLLSGGGMMHLLDSVGRSSKFSAIAMHHEQAAAIAADVYFKVSDTPGICFVTTGPGCTNAVTGVAGAYMDSHPAVFISGQVSNANSKKDLKVRQIGIQEIDPIPIVSSITKYAVTIFDPNTIRYHLEKALFLMKYKRPGPIWLDIPIDVQAAQIIPSQQKPFDPAAEGFIFESDLSQIEIIVDKIKKARRPLLVLGGGVSLAMARDLVGPLIKKLNIPVQTTWNGMDLVDSNEPLFCGRANLFGPRSSNLIIQSADLLLCIGARLGMQHTGYNISAFGRSAYKIMVDVDQHELNKPKLNIDLKIEADAKSFMEAMVRLDFKIEAKSDWLGHISSVRARFPEAPTDRSSPSSDFVDPYFFSKAISRVLPIDSVFPIGSSGMGHTILTGLFDIKLGQRVFTSKGLAAMGYGVPSAIGACLAADRKQTLTVVGEGGLQLNLQELQTIRHNKLPIKIFVFNNGGYHSIRMTQKNFFNGKYVACTDESGVSFPKNSDLAKTYGFGYEAISSNKDLDENLERIINASGPALIDVYLDPNRALEPKVVSYQKADGTMESRPIEDMAPLLDREELKKYILIDPLE